ncbi:MAG TPA: MFS transporter [Acetobacteraceae bacterium]|jgi:MFS family permease
MRTHGWLVSYGLLGLTQNGLLPVLLPLVAHSSTRAGVTYAVFSALGLAAPFLGTWADRNGRHRDLLIWGTIGAGLLLLAFDAAGASLRIVLVAGAGLGTMAATTAGNVLAIQGAAESEWDGRVARLQRFISGGQVLGLVGAGLLAHSRPGDGFVFAGLALLVAGGLAFASAPAGAARDPLHKPEPRPMVGGDAGATTSHRGHRVDWHAIAAYLKVINRPLRRFLLVWLVAYPAMNGFATIFPLAMVRQFGLDPILPSNAYAIGVGLSLVLYAPAGAITHRIGGGRMLLAGLAARLVLLIALVPLGLWHDGWTATLILAGFALIQFVWPMLSVATNSLAVRLAPDARGEAVGLFNAATSLAASVGSLLAGVVFGVAGFAALAALTCIAVAAAMVLTLLWLPDWAEHHA